MLIMRESDRRLQWQHVSRVDVYIGYAQVEFDVCNGYVQAVSTLQWSHAA